MEKYLIYLTQSGKITSARVELITKCKQLCRGEVSIYESYTFIDGTGYAKTVKDEIDFVFASHQASKLGILPKGKFIKAWGLEEYLSYEVHHLSGGWKKYLGLAMFSNIKGDSKIYFDSCRQLSDNLIKRFIKNLEDSNIQQAFFLEWDAMLLSATGMNVLYDSPSGFVTEPLLSDSLETNYE